MTWGCLSFPAFPYVISLSPSWTETWAPGCVSLLFGRSFLFNSTQMTLSLLLKVVCFFSVSLIPGAQFPTDRYTTSVTTERQLFPLGTLPWALSRLFQVPYESFFTMIGSSPSTMSGGVNFFLPPTPLQRVFSLLPLFPFLITPPMTPAPCWIAALQKHPFFPAPLHEDCVPLP